MSGEAKLAAAEELRVYWAARCDADAYPEDFDERMEAAGLITLDAVDDDDLDDAFAYERGIEPGGMVWRLTPAGLAALSQNKDADHDRP